MHATAIIPQLRTTDLDASIRFYTEVLGLQPTAISSSTAFSTSGTGKLRIVYVAGV